MAKFKFTRNQLELRKILRSEEALKVTRKVAEEILAIVGDEHYEIEEWTGINRGRVSVVTKSDGISIGHERKHHDLVRALASVRRA